MTAFTCRRPSRPGSVRQPRLAHLLWEFPLGRLAASFGIAVLSLLIKADAAAAVQDRGQRYQASAKDNNDVYAPAVLAAKSGTVEAAVASNWSNFLQGLNFTRDLHNPVLSATLDWEGANVADPAVIEEETELKMYYSGLSCGANSAIGLATAPKIFPPTSWTKQGPVFSPSSRSERWDSGWVRLGNVLKAGDTYYLYYVGSPSPCQAGTMQIGLATSTNGLNFRRRSSPVLAPSGDEVHVEDPTVLQADATHWYMYYSYRTPTLGLTGIRVAASADGINWTKVPGDVLSRGSYGEWDDTYIEHSQIYRIYDHYVLVYDGYGGSGDAPWAIGLAYSSSPTNSFTKFSGNPFFQKSGAALAFDQYHVATAALFYHDGAWNLFFQGGNYYYPYTASYWQIGLARAAVAITTPALLDAGEFGMEYHQSLSATGGTGLYSWSLASGSLPPGLNLSSDGIISGTPQEAMDTDFRVRVTSGGILYSEQDFSLTIEGSLKFTRQPASQVCAFGSNAVFTAAIAGAETSDYRWQKDDEDLDDDDNVSGAATGTLTISQLRKWDEGSYRLVVEYAEGFAESEEARLTVMDPTIVTQPANQVVIAGGTARFRVTALGTDLQYQWQRNGADLADATDASLVVSNATYLDDGAVFRASVNGVYGQAVSAGATLSLDWSPRFLNCFANGDGSFHAQLVAPPGSNVIIQSSVTGSGWVSLATNNSANGIIEFTDPLIFPDTGQPESQSTNRFYRAWLAP